jgi:hypothetical protein
MSVADFAPKDKIKFRKWLHGHLVYGEVKVTFEKKDGTTREMRCTLKEGVVPVYEKTTESTRKKNDEVMAVFDLDKNEWRSFRIDSVKEIKFDLTA